MRDVGEGREGHANATHDVHLSRLHIVDNNQHTIIGSATGKNRVVTSSGHTETEAGDDRVDDTRGNAVVEMITVQTADTEPNCPANSNAAGAADSGRNVVVINSASVIAEATFMEDSATGTGSFNTASGHTVVETSLLSAGKEPSSPAVANAADAAESVTNMGDVSATVKQVEHTNGMVASFSGASSAAGSGFGVRDNFDENSGANIGTDFVGFFASGNLRGIHAVPFSPIVKLTTLASGGSGSGRNRNVSYSNPEKFVQDIGSVFMDKRKHASCVRLAKEVREISLSNRWEDLADMDDSEVPIVDSSKRPSGGNVITRQEAKK